MKLVIDIHEKDYQSILNSGQVPYGVVCAIMNGTQLPKGHGRLIDADKLHMDYCNDNCGERKCIDAMDRCVFIDAVLNAPTIIEADKEANDG